MVASSTNTIANATFAEGSLTAANQLVWNALCGGPTAQGVAAQPNQIRAAAILEHKRHLR